MNKVWVFMRVKPGFERVYGAIHIIDQVSYEDYMFTRNALISGDFDNEYQRLTVTEIQLIKPKAQALH